MAKKYVNVVASVEIVFVAAEDREMTNEEFAAELEHAIRLNRWFHVSGARVVSERIEQE